MNRSRIVLIASAAMTVVALEGTALAADPAPAGAPAPATPATTAAPAAPAAPPPAKENEYPSRLRIGFNVNGGVGSGGDLSGPAIGATFRLGWQIDQLLGAYGQISPLVWIGTSSATGVNGSKVDVGAVSAFQLSALGSVTPIDLIEIAAGPSADIMGGGEVKASAGTTGGSSSASAFAGTYFGIHGRVALHLGGKNAETGRRRGFTIGADIHPTFTSGSTLTFFTVGLGADWF